MKEKILILAGYYSPSVKAGGPVQSIKNLVDKLKYEYDFYILANDRDLGDSMPFDRIETNKWIKQDNINIYYTNIKKLKIINLLRLIKSQKFNILYLNSFFSYSLSIIPYLLTKLNFIEFNKVIIAARGNFTEGALGQRSRKKRVYIGISKKILTYNDIIWHATSVFEKEDIQRNMGKDADVIVANNLTKDYCSFIYDKQINKSNTSLKLIYIARIHPMKNLLQVLEILQKIKGNIEFTIYGPIEDKPYWDKCQNVIRNMRKNIKVNYSGILSNEKVNSVYKEHHVAILLTLGENFGHSISEALIGGCPVIISDKTPWKNLENSNAGFDISLDDDYKIISVINNYIKMNYEEYLINSINAFNYAITHSNNDESIHSYLRMFDIHK